MRVALLHAFAPEPGGAEAHVNRLHHLLTERGHEVLVVDLCGTSAALGALAAFAPQIVHVHNVAGSAVRIPATPACPIVRTLHDHSVLCPAGSLFTRGRPCDRCTRGAFHHAGWNGCINVPDALRLSLSAAIGRWPTTRGIARFVTASTDLAARVHRAGLGTRIDVIGTFVPDDLTAAPVDARARTVVSASRLVTGKGFDVLLTAARGLEAQVVIMGAGPLRGALAARVRAEGLTHVQLTGHLAGSAYLRHLRGASIVVVPSEAAEVTPTIACEAFAAGIPVIASAVDSLPELIGRNERGVLVPPGDAPALHRAIQDLLNDDARRRAMGRAALAYAREQLSPDRYYARLTDLYVDVMTAHA